MALQKEPEIQQAVDELLSLLKENEIVCQFKGLEEKVQQNQSLDRLVEDIKQAQKDAVQFAHYGKPAAEQEAIKRADRLTKEFEQHPLVIAYREQLAEANDLLHHLTNLIQQQLNEKIEEEDYASKN